MLRRIAIAVALAIALYPRSAGADVPPLIVVPAPETPLHLRSSSTAVTDRGSRLRLPPGYFIDEPGWSKLDLELRRLQDAETRVTAENASLRKATETWQPGWMTLTLTLAVGLAGGVYLGTR